MALNIEINSLEGIINIKGPINDPISKRRINKVFVYNPQSMLYQAAINEETIN